MGNKASNTNSWRFLGGLAALALMPPLACNDNGSGDGNTDPLPEEVAVTVAGLLADTGPVVDTALSSFLAEMQTVQGDLSAWKNALASGDGDAELATLQTSWRSAMAAWEVVEVMQLGPAGSSLSAVAGEDIRDEIYSWPTINPCRIDQETVYENWGSDTYFSENLVNSYGMDAIEHLLFAELDNSCPGQVDINDDGSWDALGDEGVQVNRATFAATLADEITTQTADLIDAWAADGGDFSGQLALTTDGPYASEQEALNAIFTAMFYLETVTKDRKLATPLGYTDCSSDTCPDDVELLTSGEGARAILANLEGFELLFTNGDGILADHEGAIGFDDLLVDLGHSDLADQITADIQTAKAAAEAIGGPLDVAVSDQTADVEALYDAVKAVTDALKGDLATVLALTIPSEAAGDND